MSLDQLRILLVSAVIANVALFLALALPALLGRRSMLAADEPDVLVPPEPADIALEVAAAQGDATPELAAGLPGAAYERAVRVVSYGFLLAAAAAVALSGAWPATSTAIYALLGASALFMLLVHDVLPGRVLGAGKYVLEGLVAIGVVTLLVALTGGATSPFVLGYFLIAGGAALVVDGRTNLLLAAAISLVYLATVALLLATPRLEPADAAGLAVILVAFWLFSYLAAVVARTQRATRDVAVRLSLHDPLTRLYNRSYFFAVMEREFQRARRTGRPFCLLLLDLDGLKPINDTFGHPTGDHVLRAVADVIHSRIRAIDTAARYGGDEFVVLLPETDLPGGLTLAQKLRDGVNEIRFANDAWWVRASVSIGVASYPDDGGSPQALLDRADSAMFGSKRGGGARVGPARPLPQPGRAPQPGQLPQPWRGRQPGPAPRSSRASNTSPVPGPAAPLATAGGAPAAAPARAPAAAPVRALRPHWAPSFGGTRADSVLAALVSRGATTAVMSAPVRGSASAAGTRAASRPAAPAVSASRRAARPKRERRFQLAHHDEDAHLARTMRQLIGEGGDGAAGGSAGERAGEPREVGSPEAGRDDNGV